MDFSVIYVPKPKDRWEVHFGGKHVGYDAWNKKVALSYAKGMAKQNRPSTILIHDKSGKPEKQIEYPAHGSAVEKEIDG